MGKGDEKDFSLSLEMTMRKTVFSLLPLQGDAPKAMCEEWQPYSCGILPPSLGRRCPEGAEVGSQRNEKKWEICLSPFRHPERSRGIFFVGGKTESV